MSIIYTVFGEDPGGSLTQIETLTDADEPNNQNPTSKRGGPDPKLDCFGLRTANSSWLVEVLEHAFPFPQGHYLWSNNWVFPKGSDQLTMPIWQNKSPRRSFLLTVQQDHLIEICFQRWIAREAYKSLHKFQTVDTFCEAISTTWNGMSTSLLVLALDLIS